MIDPQLKRGLLDSCVLGVLCRGESHGYKIVKDLSACIDISESRQLFGQPGGSDGNLPFCQEAA